MAIGTSVRWLAGPDLVQAVADGVVARLGDRTTVVKQPVSRRVFISAGSRWTCDREPCEEIR
jgi:hypothetical protein